MSDYAFVKDDANYVHDVSVVHDVQEHGDEITYPGASAAPTDHASITHTPQDTESVFEEHPGRFFVERTPRTPTVSHTVCVTVNVFGDGSKRLFIGENRNRGRLVVWTDPGNTGAVTVYSRSGSGVNFAPNCQPFTFHDFREFYVSANASAILYFVEESHYVNEHGR